MTPGHRLVATVAVSTMLVGGLVAGCGKDEVDLPAPAPSTSDHPSPTSSAVPFRLPSDGDRMGVQVAARPPDDESAAGAARFAAWTLSLLLHTPREDTSTRLWSEAAGAGCDPCRRAAAVWQDQASQGQVFRYSRPPQLVRTVVRAQPQGDDWFVEYEVAVPRSTLTKDNRELQSAGAEHLDYTFTLSWVGGRWRLEDFHVLG